MLLLEGNAASRGWQIPSTTTKKSYVSSLVDHGPWNERPTLMSDACRRQCRVPGKLPQEHSLVRRCSLTDTIVLRAPHLRKASRAPFTIGERAFQTIEGLLKAYPR